MCFSRLSFRLSLNGKNGWAAMMNDSGWAFLYLPRAEKVRILFASLWALIISMWPSPISTSIPGISKIPLSDAYSCISSVKTIVSCGVMDSTSKPSFVAWSISSNGE